MESIDFPPTSTAIMQGSDFLKLIPLKKTALKFKFFVTDFDLVSFFFFYYGTFPLLSSLKLHTKWMTEQHEIIQLDHSQDVKNTV